MEEKIENYEVLVAQVKGLLEMEQDKIASLGNISAAIKQTLPTNIFSGFYLYNGEKLVLGPFQGTVSCTRIQLGKGVCGEAALENKVMIIKDVTTHKNYIACDSRARSEIVLPMYKKNQLLGVLDLDHPEVGTYDEVDEKYLQEIVDLLVNEVNW